MASLPADVSHFIGREAELAEIGALLNGSRLLSLVGAGGVGKTRLAVEAGRREAHAFADGVSLVDLGALTDPRLVAQAIATGLEVREQPRRPLVATLSDALRDQQRLLILDNCEHLLAECAALADAVLRVAARLTILVTSRTPLGIAGEIVYRVPSMEPPPADTAAGQDLMRYDAARLFLDRAAGLRPGFRLTDAHRRAIGDICRRLDGIPLAIELAAARLDVLSLDQIADRLDDRFLLLIGGSRTAMPRHRTLRALIDWSFDLLPPREQIGWRRLAIFTGAFSLEAAEAIVSGPDVAEETVLELISRLVDESVLTADSGELVARYRMLETVRAYGLDRLRQANEEVETRGRHLAWVLTITERADAEWRGEHQLVWLRRIDGELDNIRAALEWIRRDPRQGDTGLRITTALWLFWQVRGHLAEGRMWIDTFLAHGGQPSALRARALDVDGLLAYSQGDTAAAIRLLEESLAMAGEVQDEVGIALALLRLGIGAYYHGDLARSIAVLEESLGRYRRMEDRVGTHIALYELGEALTYQGDYTRARALQEEGLDIKRAIGDRWHIAFALFGLGLLDFMEGRVETAAARQRECLRMRWELNDRWGAAICFEVLGWIAAAEGKAMTAATLLGAAERARNHMGATLITPHLPNHARSVEAARRALGGEVFTRQWSLGASLDSDAVYRLALEDEQTTAGTQAIGTPLTAREVQVANLVAGGLTNREIAQRLSIAERTADAHIEHILNKLSLHSRLQIARWADQRSADAKR